MMCVLSSCWAKPKWLLVNDEFIEKAIASKNDEKEEVGKHRANTKRGFPKKCVYSDCTVHKSK